MARFSECHAQIGKPGRRYEWIPRMTRWFRCTMEGAHTIAHYLCWYYLCWYEQGSTGCRCRAVVSSSSSAALDNEGTPREMVILSKKTNEVQIPNEIFDAVLRFLPHSLLYILRQTSRGFRQYIDNDPVFGKFQTLSRWHRTVTAIVRDSREIYASIRRQTLCNECRALSTKELREWLISLCEPRRCTGCKKDHTGIFFPANGRKRNKCVGLLGHSDVCSHRRLRFQRRLSNLWTQYPIYDRYIDKSHTSFDTSDADPDLVSLQSSRS
ncbi:uncharacterized protein FMAN_13444 [Fusarium mangiferae]|uniref:F-box domain-containing protein n=1 Tax=Fusarium mangiferae TaxID=192010 RepID=A0A1L7TI56_FUSMA|nr:uncharacterized protein FMAN_13444 [Fusarium mangiferae]CVK95325.1 uncharacterized protein FMAN_13444 [Fusarium mangiferae]